MINKRTEISGSLSTLIRHCPMNKNILQALEGRLPIKNSKDQIIGYVTRIDLESDTWYGYITADISEPTLTSISMEVNEATRGFC